MDRNNEVRLISVSEQVLELLSHGSRHDAAYRRVVALARELEREAPDSHAGRLAADIISRSELVLHRRGPAFMRRGLLHHGRALASAWKLRRHLGGRLDPVRGATAGSRATRVENAR